MAQLQQTLRLSKSKYYPAETPLFYTSNPNSLTVTTDTESDEEMDLIGVQLAAITCVTCHCCKCGCEDPSSSGSSKKKQKSGGLLSKRELQSRRAASATDVFDLTSNTPRKYLPRWSRKIPDEVVLKTNRENLKKWESEEKQIWETRLSASCSSQTSLIHDGYYPPPLRPRGSVQSMFVLSEAAETEVHETESGIEQPLLQLKSIESESTSYSKSTESHSRPYAPPTPFPSAADLQRSEHREVKDLQSYSKQINTLHRSSTDHKTLQRSSKEYVPVIKLRDKKTKKTRSLTAVPDSSGYFSNVVVISEEEVMPEPILIQPSEPPLIRDPKLIKKLRKEASRRSINSDNGTSSQGAASSARKRESAFAKMRRGFRSMFGGSNR